MSYDIVPLADYVVAVQKEPESKTASGLYLPDATREKEKSKVAIVIAVGKDVEEVKEGDQVLYSSYNTTEVKLEGQKFILVKEEDCKAIVKSDKEEKKNA